MPRWIQWLTSRLPHLSDRRERPEAAFNALRATSLGLHPMLVDVPDDVPWSGALVAAMELGETAGITTIVALADGTVNVYLNHSHDRSLGHGIVGAGAHAAVRGAAERFRTVAAETRGLLQVTDDFPLPDPGQIRFQVRTIDGAYTGVAPAAALKSGRHQIAPLYAAGQDLLTEIRLATPDSRS